jgi:hypothetical protein
MSCITLLNSIKPYVPLLTPAVQANRCEVDRSLLASRVQGVAIVILAAIAVSITITVTFSLSPLFIWPCLGLFGFLFGFFKLDEWLSEQAVNEKAVQEYLKEGNPSSSATAWIQQDRRRIELLIQKKGDINKQNKEGRRLIDNLINPLYYNSDKQTKSFECFKLLVDNDANLKDKDPEGLKQLK